jgi:hypothetical protein
MLEINIKDKKLVKIEDTEMKSQKIMERNDLQEYIVNSWQLFTNEIGMPDIYDIGKEIYPHNSVKDRIDILAFDPNESNMIIFELKRDKEKNQLIQSISYAGMINTWTSSDVLSKINKVNDELVELFSSDEIDFGIKIVLIAEYFEPEVILAADWLKTQHNVNISAYTIQLHKLDEKILFDIEQKYPLKELVDVYEARKRKQNQKNTGTKRSWSDVKQKLQYKFGNDAIDYLCKNYSQGDPGRARFVTTLSKDGINNIIISFRYKYVNIYSWISNKEEGKEVLKKIFNKNMVINEWQEGLSFNIIDEKDYNKLIEWLDIKKSSNCT